MRRAIAALAPFAVFLLMVSPVFAPDVPYSHAPGVTTCDFGGGIFPSEWSQVNGFAGELVNGQTDSDFNGLTLTSIGAYLCLTIGSSNPPNPPVSGQTFLTIAVFDSAGNVVSAFGTVDIAVLPIAYSGHNSNAQEFTRTGSHVMQPGEIIGITFSDNLHGPPSTSYSVQTFCGEQCDPNTLPQPNGQIVDCSAIGNCGNSFRYAFAGDFLFGNSPPPPPPQSPSTKASAFVGAVFVISMASIVLVAYERPDKTQEAVRYVGPIAVGLAVVFVVLAVAGV